MKEEEKEVIIKEELSPVEKENILDDEEEEKKEDLTQELKKMIEKKEEELESFKGVKEIEKEESSIIPPSPFRHVSTMIAISLLLGGGFLVFKNISMKQNADKTVIDGENNE